MANRAALVLLGALVWTTRGGNKGIGLLGWESERVVVDIPASSEMEQEELDHAEMFKLSGNYAFNAVRALNPPIQPLLLLQYFIESYSTSDEHQLLQHLPPTAPTLNASDVTRLTPSLVAGALGGGNDLLF